MTRAVLVLNSPAIRERAATWCRNAPPGTRVEYRGPGRNLDQNARMWAMLTDISKQKLHMGRRYSTDAWKVLFMHALGQEVTFLPALDGSTFVPYGQHSSDLSKAEMSDLIELMMKWGAENGVSFNDHAEAAA